MQLQWQVFFKVTEQCDRPLQNSGTGWEGSTNNIQVLPHILTVSEPSLQSHIQTCFLYELS